MMITCTLACLTLFIISPVISANVLLNCTKINNRLFDLFETRKPNSNDYSVQLEFDRNNTKIHQYNGTSSVSVYVGEPNFHVQAKVPGRDKPLSFNNHGLIEVIGVANMVNTTDNRKNLTNCEFYVVNKASGRTKSDMLYDLYEECLNLHFCQAFGSVQKGNLVTPQKRSNNKSEFIAVDSLRFGVKHRTPITQFLLLKLDNKAQLDQMTNLMTRELSHDLKMKNDGTLEVPDEGFFMSVSHGVFEHLDEFKKSQSSLIRPANGTATSRNLSMTFVYPDLRLTYNNAKLMKFVPSVDVCVGVKNMTFDALISLDVMETKCRANLIHFITRDSGKATVSACKPSTMDFIAKLYEQNAWNDRVVVHVRNYVEKTLSEYVERSFGCENN